MTKTQTCERCGHDVIMHAGEPHNFQEYDNGRVYPRGLHKPDCDRTMAARESWAKRDATVTDAIAEARRIRDSASNP